MKGIQRVHHLPALKNHVPMSFLLNPQLKSVPETVGKVANANLDSLGIMTVGV
jgi:hypothetical protein